MIVIEAKKLQALIANASSIYNPKSPLPIASQFGILCRGGKIYISATDMDHTLVESENIDKNIEESFFIRGDIFSQAIKRLTGSLLLEKESEGSLRITCGKTKLLFYITAHAFEFPDTSAFEEIITLDSKILKNLIEKTSISTSNVCTNLLNIKNNRLDLAITDRRRLSIAVEDLPRAPNMTKTLLLSQKTISEVNKILEGSVTIRYHHNQVLFEYEKGFFISKLANDKPFNYEQVIQQRHAYQGGLVNRKNLIDAINRVTVASSEIKKVIKLQFSPGELFLYSFDPNVGQAEDVLITNCNFSGVTNLNYEFLLAALKKINTPEVKIFFKDETSHFFVCSEETSKEADNFQVLVPIRMTRDSY